MELNNKVRVLKRNGEQWQEIARRLVKNITYKKHGLDPFFVRVLGKSSEDHPVDEYFCVDCQEIKVVKY